MMNEIIRTRNTLTNYIHSPRHSERSEESRTIYSFKRDAIQNSLYGVDIDPGAVEIAKLRLWLSLVVDEQDIKQIKPLPNLDYKIMQGNSLLEEFEGVRLFDEELISKPSLDDDEQIKSLKQRQSDLQHEFIKLYSSGNLNGSKKQELDMELKKVSDLLKRLNRPEKPKSENGNLFDIFSEAKKKAQELKQLHKEFFEASQKTRKDEIKKRIEKLEWELIEVSLSEQNKISSLKKLEQYKKTNIKPFFLWRLNFAEVFQEKGGFDVVIGNPPYLRIQGIQKDDPELAQKYKQLYKSATGAFDLYVLFLERGLSLLNSNGTLNFILPHKWVNSAFGIGIRKLIHINSNARKMISFGAHQVFNASNYTSLLWLTENPNKALEYFEFSRDLVDNTELENALNKLTPDDYNFINSSSLDENPWVLTDSKAGKVLKKLSEQPLKVKDVFIKIFQGIATSDDKVFVLTHRQEKTDTEILFSKALNEEVEIEKDLLRPFLMGKDVHLYIKPHTKSYIIFPYLLENGAYQLMSTDHLSKNYPLGWNYLIKNKERLQKREHGIFKKVWWCFSRPQNMDFFERQKIITPEISSGSNMTVDFGGTFFHTTKCYSLLKKDSIKEDYRFFLGILNSRLLWFFLKNTGYVLRGGYFTFKTNYLEPFPLPKINGSSEYDQIVKIVDKIYSLTDFNLDHKTTSSEIKDLEKQIDQLVYKLYGLTPEEIAIVEGK